MDGWTQEEANAVAMITAFVDTYLIYTQHAVQLQDEVASVIAFRLAPITAHVHLFAVLDTMITHEPAGGPVWVELGVSMTGRLLHMTALSDSIAEVLKEQGFSKSLLQNISSALATWLDRHGAPQSISGGMYRDPQFTGGQMYQDLASRLMRHFSLACHTFARQTPTASPAAAAPAPPCGTSARATVWQCVLGVPDLFRVLLRAGVRDCTDQSDHLRAAQCWFLGYTALRKQQASGSSSSPAALHFTARDIQQLLDASGQHGLRPADLLNRPLSLAVNLFGGLWNAIDGAEQTRAFYPLATFLHKLLQLALGAEHSAAAAPTTSGQARHPGQQGEACKPADLDSRQLAEGKQASRGRLLDNVVAAAAVIRMCLSLDPIHGTAGASQDVRAHSQLIKSRAQWAVRSGLLDATQAVLRRCAHDICERPASGVQLAHGLLLVSCGVALQLPDEPRAQLAFQCHVATVRKTLEMLSLRQDTATRQQPTGEPLSQQRLQAQQRALLEGCAMLCNSLAQMLMDHPPLQHTSASSSDSAAQATSAVAELIAIVHVAVLQLLPALVRIARVSRPSLLRTECASLFLTSFTAFHRCGLAPITAAAGAPEVVALALYCACHSGGLESKFWWNVIDHTLGLMQAAGADTSWLSEGRRLGLTVMVREVGHRLPLAAQLPDTVYFKASMASGASDKFDAPAELELWKLIATADAAATAAAAGGGVRRVVDGRSLPFMGCWNRRCTNVERPSEARLALRNCGGCRHASYCSEECQRRAWVGGHREACQVWQCRK